MRFAIFIALFTMVQSAAMAQSQCGMICLFDQNGSIFTTDIKVTQTVFFLSADSTKVKLVLEYKNTAGQKLGSTSLRLKDGVKGVNSVPSTDATWAGADPGGWFYRFDSLNSTMFSGSQQYATNPYRSGGKEVRFDFGIRNGSLSWYGNVACTPCGLYWKLDLKHSCSQVFSPPSLSITSNDPLCGQSNGSATATPTGGAVPYSFLWSNGGTTNSISNLVAGTYTVTVTDANGASVSKSVVLVNQGSASASILSTANQLNCAVQSATLTATGNGTFLWSNGLTTPSISINQQGIYSVTVTTANGCTASASQSISQDSTIASASISSTVNQLNCAVQSATLTATGNGTFLWSNGLTTPSISINQQGVYSVTVTAANGCTASASQSISQDSTIASASISSTVNQLNCAVQSATLTATGNGTFLWSNGLTTPSISINQQGVYSVTVTAANGCTASASQSISQDSTIASASISSTVNQLNCAVQSATLTATGNGTFLWSNGLTTPSISINQQGVYSVTVTAANGCTASASQSISQDSTIASASISSTVNQLNCAVQSATLTATGNGTFLWSNGLTTPSISINQQGIYSVTVTTANGCTASASQSISQDSTIASASISSTVNQLNCAVQSATLTATGNGTFLWSNGLTTPSISINQQGIYSVTVTAANGCTASASQSISQDSTIASASISSTANQLNCAVQSATLTATGNGTFLWSNGLTTPSISINQQGVYSVTVTAANGCTASASQSISIADTLSLSTSTEQIKCFGGSNGSISLTAETGKLPVSYIWADGIGEQDRNDLAVGTYTVTATDANGCTVIESFTLLQPEALTVSDSIVHEKCREGYGGEIWLDVKGGVEPYTFNWSEGNFEKTAVNVAKGFYSVIITDINGCVITKDSMEIRCPGGYVYPNPSQSGIPTTFVFDELNGKSGDMNLQFVHIGTGRTEKTIPVQIEDGRVIAYIDPDFPKGDYLVIAYDEKSQFNCTLKFQVQGK